MKMHTKLTIFLFLFFFTSALLAQQPHIVESLQLKDVESYRVVSANETFTLTSDRPISAIAIKTTVDSEFLIQIGKEWVLIPKDDDAVNFTYFISLPLPILDIEIQTSSNEEFQLFMIHSGQAPEIEDRFQSRLALAQDCFEPLEYISQETWRSELDAPNYSRSFHEVSHNIVHHSAGSNSNSNYTQVVRDIYLYHTQVNGWSDIGYNYLIAQDGSIYAGRDPDGGSQDNVRGAHFCGSNSGTLGICLLGNYETTNPTEPTWQSLQNLLTYQLLNQELNPFDSYDHPLGNIGTIAGHRDGCSTLCPGEHVYSQLEDLKGEVDELMEFCKNGSALAFSADREFTKVNELVSYTNESGFYDEYRWIFEGGVPSESTNPSPRVVYSVSGIYDVSLIGIKGNTMDTLVKDNFIQVSTFPAQPMVFPNPVSTNSDLKIDSQDEIDKTELYSINGKLAGEWDAELEITIPPLKKGVYFLKIYAGSRIYERKLMIE